MIITQLIGGVGNQLFQYAAGRSLALHHQTELLLDVSAFSDNKIRNFELASFNAAFHIASIDQLNDFIHRSLPGKIRDRIFPRHLRKFYKEPFFHFDQTFFKASSNVYLKGYWQSEKYFSIYSDVIRNELSLKKELIESVNEFGKKLKETNSVSVHIRRGDLTENIYSEYHGILKMDYYKEALQMIQTKIPNASFYFFSDDINWVKENFSLLNAVYVSDNITKNHIEDLYLMSQCRHNIIANSSFSWWGAWLNNHPGKIVIAPKNWFNKGPKDTYDLYPPDWTII